VLLEELHSFGYGRAMNLKIFCRLRKTPRLDDFDKNPN
jgi:hypothetical protein